MLLGNRQEATLTQLQGLGLVARQSVEVLVLAGSELAALLDHPVAMRSRQGRGTVITVDVGYGQSEPEG